MQASPKQFLALLPEEESGKAEAAASAHGFQPRLEARPGPFLEVLAGSTPDLVLVSFGVDGVDPAFLERVVEAVGGPEPVVASAPGASLELAVAARRLGVGPLLREPLDEKALADELRRRGKDGRGLEISAAAARPEEPGLVGSGAAMAGIVRKIVEVGDTPATVLLTGESGTGKELVARAIHWASLRRERPFVAINCAAIPEQLLESEFFGHERGAFTGAVARKEGRFERAHGGTLFLDEVGDMSPVLQSKLLRALAEREIERVGGEGTIPVDVRVLAATNRRLEDRVAEGDFREDLFYRLAVVRIEVPALRERMEDLEELVAHFVATFAERYGREVRGVDEEALRVLRAYPWPGNVRELQNVLDGAVLSCRGGWMRGDDLVLGAETPRLSGRSGGEGGYPPTASLEEVERDHIARVLRFTNGAMGEAAAVLGIHRNTLTRKVAQYGLGAGREEGER